jgi:hypothetical protein
MHIFSYFYYGIPSRKCASLYTGKMLMHNIHTRTRRATNINFARRNKTNLGPRGQAETSLKIEYLSWKYKKKRKEKIKIKRQWLKLWGPSEIHGPLLGSPG